MAKSQDKTLVKRIAGLVEENKELKKQVKELSEKNEKYTRIIEKFRDQLSQYTDVDIEDLRPEIKSDTLRFKMATVLFAEFVGFRRMKDEESTHNMIDELDNIFFQFEDITKKYKIERIKSIGDTYMCAGGVPQKNITNPIDVVMAALEMQQYVETLKAQYKMQKKDFWDLRIGLHTGSVTAYISGKKKISYDLKGDTVNIASRMKSAAEPGKINISVMTYELVKEYFTCDYNGKMPVKYQGDLEMYNVRRIKLAYSENRKGKAPNDIFHNKYLLRQFSDIQEIVLDKLEKELPEFLYYHNVKHTIDVVTQAELIGYGEGVSDEDILLLKTAALFHDAGQIQGSKDHEDRGAALAKEELPKFGYTEQHIEMIEKLIMATKLPPNPRTILEKIMCDADLDYLGRADFIPVSNTLFEELKAQNIITNLNDWNKLQVKFLSGHQFFTRTANSLREVNKQQQIERIKGLITED